MFIDFYKNYTNVILRLMHELKAEVIVLQNYS